LLEFLVALRKKRKIDFLILNDIFSSTTEKEIANQVCEQANSYKKHYQLLRIGQDIIACLGRFKNIIDFYIEDGSINFALKDNEIINQKVLNELEIVKKTKTSAKNLTSLFINHDMEALYQIMKKIIRDNPCSLYVSSG
jgi:phosphotransferase system IIB component